MNFLAHLFLSDQSDDALLGALLGDFVKGPLDQRYSPVITAAIRLHRHIDVFTDAHAAVLASKARVSPVRRRYAGIMVDMFYDHFLARYWEDYATVSLDIFTRRVYQVLSRRHAELPDKLRRIAPNMIEFDWLGSYREVNSVAAALDRMGSRLRRGNGLLDSGEDLLREYAAFEADFRAFFPEVILFACADEAGFVVAH